MRRVPRALWLALALALTVPSMAAAQDINTPHSGGRPFQLDIHGGFAWHGNGVASGVRFGIPIMNNGFISSLNNAVYINFGADLYYVHSGGCGGGGRFGCGGYGIGLGIPVTLHWEFYLNQTWSIFAEVGPQFYMHPRFLRGDSFGVHAPGNWFVAQVGGRLRISDWFMLTLRVGNPYVSFGVTFEFGG